MKKITPCLWYNFQAEEAVNFYASVFKNVKILSTTYYTAGSPGPAGKVMTINFELNGQEFIALNGGPEFPFSEAVSFYIQCENQPEVDELWEKLSAGGEKSQCGWLKDRFGVSWQIVPIVLEEMLLDRDPEKVQRVTQALLQMNKLDIAVLKQAYEQA
jgi:predicted 3-demethylubiquinone-9 3-methyltransferase (glyoxalase superfamily)